MAPVPESVSRSINTCSDLKLKRLYDAFFAHSSRSLRLLRVTDSTILILKGSQYGKFIALTFFKFIKRGCVKTWKTGCRKALEQEMIPVFDI